MKQIVAWLMALTAIAISAHRAVAYDFEADGFGYSILFQDNDSITFRLDAVNNNDTITSVTIPSYVTFKGRRITVSDLGPSVFQGSAKLETVIIPPTLTTIYGSAFNNCPKLKFMDVKDCPEELIVKNRSTCRLDSVYLGRSLYNVSLFGELGDNGLRKITVGGDCSYVGSLNSLKNLKELQINKLNRPFALELNADTKVICYLEEPPALYNKLPYRFRLHGRVYVPDNAIEKYREAQVWRDIEHICPLSALSIPVPDAPDYDIEENGWRYSYIGTIEIPDGRVTGFSAVRADTTATGMVTVPLEAGPDWFHYPVIAVGTNAFRECSHITGITIPSSIMQLNGCFQNIKDGEPVDIVIEDSETKILLNTTLSGSTVGTFYLGRPIRKDSDWYFSTFLNSAPTHVKTLSFGRDAMLKELEGLWVGTGRYSPTDSLIFGRCSEISNLTVQNDAVKVIVSLSPEPPALKRLGNDEVFTSKNYVIATLYVPDGSVEAYKKAEGWKNFWEIRPLSESSGIGAIEADGAEDGDVRPGVKGIYDLQGRRLESATAPGLYIIDGRKVLVR